MNGRIQKLQAYMRRRRLDALLIEDVANIRALTDIVCDNAVFELRADGSCVFHTDFRYTAMVHRVAPKMKVRDIRKFKPTGQRIGYAATISHERFLELQKVARRATFVDCADELANMRAVKTADEIVRLRAAEKLNCEIWNDARLLFKPGMSERDMARIIQTQMVNRGEGEAFETIVCVGANAAECHHEPDDTVWDGRSGVLVDMGVRLGGVCSDLTRNILPTRRSATYRRVFDLVKEAHDAAIAAARPGMTARQLDRVAREVIRKGGFGKCFGHSLGHGVGFEVHEAPAVSKRDKTVLKPGMIVTIEPGIYLEGNLGVRIEDMILITETGCEVLSSAALQ